MDIERAQRVAFDDAAVEHLVSFCLEHQYSKLIMVADNQTNMDSPPPARRSSSAASKRRFSVMPQSLSLPMKS